jgi:hypothetical protein
MTVWLLLQSDGSVFSQVISELHPCDPPEEGATAPYAWPRDRVVIADRPGKTAIESWNQAKGKWELNAEMVEVQALAEIDSIRAAAMKVEAWRSHVYQKKLDQARMYLASTATIENLPWIAAEAEATGKTPGQLARSIIQAADEADRIAARLEASFIAAKESVRAAKDPAVKLAEARKVIP